MIGGDVSTVTADAIDYSPDLALGLSLVQETVPVGAVAPRCPNTLTDYSSRSSVYFGTDQVGGCTLHLKKSDFNACTTLRTKIYNLQTLTASKIKYIGIFGNASVNNMFDWIKVISDPPDAINGQTPQVISS